MAKSAKTPQPCTCSKFEIYVNLRENDTDGDLIYDELITTNCGGRTTLRTFAPGHDARLKGYLIRAGVAGHEVTFTDGGMAYTSGAIDFADKYGFGQQVRRGIAGGMIKAEIRKLKGGQRSVVAERAEAKVSLADTVAAEEAEHAAKELAARQAQQAQMLAEDDECSHENVKTDDIECPDCGADVSAMWAGAHTDEDKAKYADPADPADAPQIVKAKVGRWTYEGVIVGGVFHYEAKGVAKTATKFTTL